MHPYIYPLVRNLSGGQRYPTFEQPGPGQYNQSEDDYRTSCRRNVSQCQPQDYAHSDNHAPPNYAKNDHAELIV